MREMEARQEAGRMGKGRRETKYKTVGRKKTAPPKERERSEETNKRKKNEANKEQKT